MFDFTKYGIEIPYGRTSGQVKCVCPACRSSRTHPNDRSLSVNIDLGVWRCHHCGWEGRVVTEVSLPKPKRQYQRPVYRPITELSRKTVAWFNGRGISEKTLLDLKISEGEEFIPQVGRKRNTVQFNYFKNGELVNIKYRDGQKNFKLCKDAELIPYNLDAVKGSKECIITEGEMDALSYHEVGCANVVSVPNGAGARNLSYLDDCMEEYFSDKETIYIAADSDARGVELRNELVRRFGSHRCRIVTYLDCKDANELLQKHGKEKLLDSLKNAPYVPMEGIVTLPDYESELDELYAHGLQKGLTLGLPNFDELCSFETKRFAVVTGRPGSGKSEMLDDICVRLNIRYGFKVAYFSPENMPVKLHAVKIIEKLTGLTFEERSMPMSTYEEAKRYVEDNFFHIFPTEDQTLTHILDLGQYLVRKAGIRILVIDPYNRVESERKSTQSENDYVSAFIDRITRFAVANDCLVFLMAHPRKPDLKNPNYVPTTYDIAGSAHFFNKADYSIILDRNKSEGYTNVIVEKVKFRHLGMGGVAKMRYDLTCGRFNIFCEGMQGPYNRNNFIKNPKGTDYEPAANEKPPEPTPIPITDIIGPHSRADNFPAATPPHREDADLTPIDDNIPLPF